MLEMFEENYLYVMKDLKALDNVSIICCALDDIVAPVMEKVSISASVTSTLNNICFPMNKSSSEG